VVGAAFVLLMLAMPVFGDVEELKLLLVDFSLKIEN
jgi:hypothetical protein